MNESSKTPGGTLSGEYCFFPIRQFRFRSLPCSTSPLFVETELSSPRQAGRPANTIAHLLKHDRRRQFGNPGLSEAHGWVRPCPVLTMEKMKLEMEGGSTVEFFFEDSSGKVRVTGPIQSPRSA